MRIGRVIEGVLISLISIVGYVHSQQMIVMSQDALMQYYGKLLPSSMMTDTAKQAITMSSDMTYWATYSVQFCFIGFGLLGFCFLVYGIAAKRKYIPIANY